MRTEKSAKLSAKTGPNYDDFKSAMEKTSHTETSCRYLHQTDFANRIPGSHKHTYLNSNKKRMLPRMAASSNNYFTVLSLVHCFQHLSRRCFLLGRQGCPTVKHLFQIRGQFYHFSLSKELG